MADDNGVIRPDDEFESLKEGFLHWQCWVRQFAAQGSAAMENPGVRAALILAGGTEPITEVATVLNRRTEYSQTARMREIVRGTDDPELRGKRAMKFFSEHYYHAPEKFTDTLTATFLSDSKLAVRLAADGACTLRFEQLNRTYELPCKVASLPDGDPLREATFWYNVLFNPGLAADCQVLGFEPDWVRVEARTGAN